LDEWIENHSHGKKTPEFQLSLCHYVRRGCLMLTLKYHWQFWS